MHTVSLILGFQRMGLDLISLILGFERMDLDLSVIGFQFKGLSSAKNIFH